tara:strand:+ start:2445 stop:4127 length:1683 start_codon:yes stop_codon:yes gene_type:complete
MSDRVSIAIIMAILTITGFLAGCIDAGSDDDSIEQISSLPASDGGYEYASNVDDQRMLIQDVCEVKQLTTTHNWTAINDIYVEGANSKNSDGSNRTLESFASSSGKFHGLDTYYDTTAPLNEYVTSALEGSGIFQNASNSMREQAIEVGFQDQIMVAHAIHKLNAAIIKAEAGNWDINSGAVHAWDEAWAFYHGLESNSSCSPYDTGVQLATSFGTIDSDGNSAANLAILQAMNDGKTALLIKDVESAKTARDQVLKNLVVIYSQASIHSGFKMSSATTLEDAQKFQVEGNSFWRIIESIIADESVADIRNYKCYANDNSIVAEDFATCDLYTFVDNHTLDDGQDLCYNQYSHLTTNDDNETCSQYIFINDYTKNDGESYCFNSVMNSIINDSKDICNSYQYYENYTWGNSTFTGCYNIITHVAESNISQEVCEAFIYFDNYGATVTDICYNMATLLSQENASYEECSAYSYVENFGATTFTGCYNSISYNVILDLQSCDFNFVGLFGVSEINAVYDFDNLPVYGFNYSQIIHEALEVAWNALGIDVYTEIGDLFDPPPQ